MVPQERQAYRILWFLRHPELRSQYADNPVAGGAPASNPGERISQALEHGGAQLESYWSLGEERIVVRYVIDGRTHVSEVRPGDLTVLSSGICLSGLDQEFDLTSLVGVLREHAQEEY